MFVDCHDIGKIEFRNWEKICETSFFEFLRIFLAQKNGGPNCVIFSKMNEVYLLARGRSKTTWKDEEGRKSRNANYCPPSGY